MCKSVTNELKAVLKDGEFHPKRELFESTSCPTYASFKYQLLLYRRQLPIDEALICELVRRTIGYRQVKLLNSISK